MNDGCWSALALSFEGSSLTGGSMRVWASSITVGRFPVLEIRVCFIGENGVGEGLAGDVKDISSLDTLKSIGDSKADDGVDSCLWSVLP